MSALTSEQKTTVAGWVAAGDSLSTVQKKLRDEFGITMTYMDVRFLVDDLNLEIKDPVIPAKPQPKEEKKTTDAAVPDTSDAAPLADEEEALPVVGNVSVSVDGVTLIPGALASGTVTFSDGVAGKWIVDQYGRPGFTEVSQPGYRPSPDDAQAFMQQLDAALRDKGF